MKKEIELFVKEECEMFVRRLAVRNGEQGDNVSMVVNSPKQFPTLPALPTTLSTLFTSVTNLLSTHMHKST